MIINWQKFFLVLSRLADFLTITGLSLAFIFGWIKQTKSPTGFMVNQFVSKFFKVGIIIILYAFLIRSFLPLVYFTILLIIKGYLVSGTEFWENGKELQHTLSYILTSALSLPIFFIIGTTIWNSSFEHTIELLNLILPKSLKIQTNKYRNETILEIISAVYKTDNIHSIDITQQVKKMVIDNKLEITSGNDLGGDPRKGHHKNLIITYRINGIEKTEVIPEYRTKIIPS